MPSTRAHSRRHLVGAARSYRSPWDRARGWLYEPAKQSRFLLRVLARRAQGSELSAQDERMPRLEAALLLAHEPLGTRKLAQLAKLADGTEARSMIGQLNKRYDAAGRAFRVEEVAGGYQLLTRPQFATWLRRWAGAPAEIRLSAPAVETLAVVAYRQPVLRAEIEALRGVQCGEMLRQLMERGLVRIAGRADELGRPFLYGTTRHFLQVFGLRNLDELPQATMLRGITGEASDAPPQAQEAVADAEASDAIDKESAMTMTLHPSQELEGDEALEVSQALDESRSATTAIVDDEEEEDGDDEGIEDGEWEEVDDEASDDDDEDDDAWEDDDDDWDDEEDVLEDEG